MKEIYDREDFENRLPNQAEFCARKVFEFLKRDIGRLSASEIYSLAMSAKLFLEIRDSHGKK